MLLEPPGPMSCLWGIPCGGQLLAGYRGKGRAGCGWGGVGLGPEGWLWARWGWAGNGHTVWGVTPVRPGRDGGLVGHAAKF